MAALQDAQSYGAPVLGTGPGALEVGYKRMGIEADAGKLAAQQKIAADKLAQKEKEANAKEFKFDPKAVFLTHQNRYSEIGKENERLDALALQAYKEGKGTDPYDPGTPAGMERKARMAAEFAWANKSNQIGTFVTDLVKMVEANPTKFKPGSMEKIVDYAANVENVEKGNMPDPLIGMYDTDKDLNEAFGAIKPSQTAYASADGLRSGTHEFVLPVEVKAIAEQKAAHPYIKVDLEERFAELPIERQEQVKAQAEEMGMSIPATMAFNVGNAWAVFDKRTAISEQASAAGRGIQLEQEGMNWLAEWRKGVEEGKYEGTGSLDLFGLSAIPKDKIPEAYRTLSGWVYDKYKDEKGKTKETRISGVQVSRDNKTWNIKLDNGEEREIPYDKFESEVIPRIGALNEDKLKGIAKYINAAKESGYFQDIKGTGTKEMVKTNPPKTGVAAWGTRTVNKPTAQDEGY